MRGHNDAASSSNGSCRRHTRTHLSVLTRDGMGILAGSVGGTGIKNGVAEAQFPSYPRKIP